MTQNSRSHISVCVCTFKRPALLAKLLAALDMQETGGLFTYSIVVADNDRLRSAESVVMSAAASSSRAFTYCVEPRQNIALARNKAIQHAHGDMLAFIDDDECPSTGWLRTLFRAFIEHNVDGVLGPVKPDYDATTPAWVIRGKFYERPVYPTGTAVRWTMGRTGNMLLARKVFEDAGPQPFRPEFRTGEDQDFFRRAIESGRSFIWCDEAVVYEAVPPTRSTRSFMLRMALLRGRTAVVHPTFGIMGGLKTLAAVPAYTAVLPFAAFLGQHRFMTILIKLVNHLGKLCGLLGIEPVRTPYVTG